MSSNFDNGFGIQLREWELGPNSTRYDNIRAAPSDHDVHAQWIAFITVIVSSIFFQVAVFVAILRDKHCRKNAFNTYILFMMPPDIAFGIFCIITCALNLASTSGQFYSLASCKFQAFYIVFVFSSSSWLNAIVAYQLHSLLTYSHQAKRYHAPKRKKVAQHAFLVYAWSAFIGSWPLWTDDDQWWPISTGLYSGSYCLPMAYDTKSLLFFYLVFAPCVFFIPLVYICYASIDIWRKGLLPPPEKRQNFMVFLRVVIIYFLIWIPVLAMSLLFGYWFSGWWTFMGGLWAHLQGPISAAICLVKPDVRKAFRNVICCGRAPKDITPENDSTSRGRRSSQSKHSNSNTWIHQSAHSFFGSLEIEDGDGENAFRGSKRISGESGRTERDATENSSHRAGDNKDIPRNFSAVNMAGQVDSTHEKSVSPNV